MKCESDGFIARLSLQLVVTATDYQVGAAAAVDLYWRRSDREQTNASVPQE